MTQQQSSRVQRFVDACARGILRARLPILLLFALVTAGLGYNASRLRLDPGIEKMIPLSHEYMQAYAQYADVFSGANRILVSLRWNGEGDLYNAEFLRVLQEAADEVFFIPGVDRVRVLSLYSPQVRYTEVTEEGFRGAPVMPERFDGSPEELAALRANVARSGQIGRLVANDLKAALVRADLFERDPQTGARLDYIEVAQRLEAIRSKFENRNVEVHIIGFAKVMGDVVEALGDVLRFFALAFVITAVLLLLYSRSLQLTLLALAVALLPVVWLLGLLPWISSGIDPMSILVPFLIFSIGVSHAVQMTNTWRLEMLGGSDARSAAHAAFAKLAIPGTLALLTNALGFLVIMQIEIPIVRELGIMACLGVSLMIFTNKVLLPVLLSFLRWRITLVAPRQRPYDGSSRGWWWSVSAVGTRGPALAVLGAASVLLLLGAVESRRLTVGDVGSGEPSFRQTARYNQDYRAITRQYNIGVDVLSVIVEPRGFEPDACLHYAVVNGIERFERFLRGVHGVRAVQSVPDGAKVAIAGQNEGMPLWAALPRSQRGLQQASPAFLPALGFNTDLCSAIQVLIYPDDHAGVTLAHIVAQIKHYLAQHPIGNVEFRLAGGNAGVMAATNEAVERAEVGMLVSIFGAISLLCWLSFRSWRAVVAIIVPLAIVSVLCNALMAVLGIGLQVSTLPVIALGVGVGVDYGIYLYERIQHERAAGRPYREALYEAFRQRGTAAMFTATTMAIGVATWSMSTLKFQADMGLLLAFMFAVNALGAVLLLPVLVGWLEPDRSAMQRPASHV